jgi:micrococcal nuclease
MRPGQRRKRAPWTGAFFAFAAWPHTIVATPCSAPDNSEPVQVRHVHDGDTLILADNRKLRLIGINTPELAREGDPPEALALKSRDRLRELLVRHSNSARILDGREKRDRHGRLLAHLWLPDGTNLTARLLREGLGWAIVVPPNVRYVDCYLASEKAARSGAMGVWSNPDLAPTQSTDLNLRDRGFHRVAGRVTRVNHGGGATWINLQGQFAVRIPDSDLHWFEQPPDQTWVGQELAVRGWLYPVRGELRVTAYHPAALELRPAETADPLAGSAPP